MENDKIKEVNRHISNALDWWADVMLEADAKEMAYNLNYTEDDLLNALYIFNHVAQNIGIKNKTLDLSNVEAAGEKMRETVRVFTGYDARQLIRNDKKVN